MDTFQWFEVTFMLLTIGLILVLQNDISNLKKTITQIPVPINIEGNRLKLQALERLTLYAERSALKNLVGRIDYSKLSAAELHQILIETLKTEFDYNSSQQIYVSPEIWNAVTRMKDQNIYIINHITANLAPHANGAELSRMLLEYSMTPNAEMSYMLLDALQFEAKKILN
jgi:hypothetical protein